MINEQDRNSLIKYRLQQAKDTIDLATKRFKEINCCCKSYLLWDVLCIDNFSVET